MKTFLWPPKVLVVDDQEIFRKTGTIACSDFTQPKNIREAEQGEEALQIAQTFQPDVILLDVMMPKMDGSEVLRRLKSDPSTEDIAVVMFTAQGNQEITNNLLGNGAHDYASKLIDPDELVLRLRNAILLKQTQEAHQKQLNQQKIEGEIAAAIQQGLLPTQDLTDHLTQKGWRMAWFARAAEVVSGDIIFARLVQSDTVLSVLLADVQHHGIPSGMLTMFLPGASVSCPSIGLEPGNLLSHISNQLTQCFPAELSRSVSNEIVPQGLTAIHAMIHLDNGRSSIGTAGHHPALLISSEGEIRELTSSGAFLQIGKKHEPDEFRAWRGDLTAGEKLFLYSDGLDEHRNRELPRGERLFCEGHFQNSIRKHAQLPAQEFLDAVVQDWISFSPHPPNDDCSIFVLERKERS